MTRRVSVLSGHGGFPTCPDCEAWMQHVGGRWRCPWTRQGDARPPDGEAWSCGRPYGVAHRPDLQRPFGLDVRTARV